MFCIRINYLISLTALLFAISGVSAADNPADIKERIGAGDPVAGKEKSAFCQGCHGEDGNSTDSSYPKLAGQYAGYIEKQVKEFQSGARTDPIMSAMAMSAGDDQDIQDIAAYFASQKQMKGSRQGLDNKAGRAAYKRGKSLFNDGGNGCYNCHGKRGKGGTRSAAPVIVGQHKDYIVKQLSAFGSHSRTNDPSGMMRLITGYMAPEDMDAVATYVSTF